MSERKHSALESVGIGIAALFVIVIVIPVGLGLVALANKPVMGWRADPSFSFVLNAGETRRPFTFDSGARIRVEVHSTLPISHSVTSITQAVSSSHACSVAAVTLATSECVVPSGDAHYLAIVDDRPLPTAGSALTAAGLAYVGIKGPAEQMGAPNSVTVTISGWKCIEHCGGN